jgi:colicin import membrane protein
MAAAVKAAAAKAAAAKAAAEKAAAEKAAAEKAAAEKAAAEKAAAEKAAASPAGQFQRAQELEKAGQMRPAKAAYERAAEGGNAAAAKRRWEIAVAEKATPDEIARWQRRAFQLGAPGVPEPRGPAVLR